MADNVQGFNHLDEVLMNLGNQFRQDAIKKMMLKNQADRTDMMAHRPTGGGAFANQPIRVLMQMRNQLQQYQEAEKQKYIQSRKDVTGVTPSSDEADDAFAKTHPDVISNLDQISNAAMGYLSKSGVMPKQATQAPMPKSQVPIGNPLNPFGMP